MKSIRTVLLGALLVAASTTASAAQFIFGPNTLAPGQVDYFDFVVDAGSFVGLATFDLSVGADTILTLLDGVGGFLAENDDAVGVESTIVQFLTPGNYQVAVSGYSNFFPFASPGGSTPGDYSLVIFGDGVASAAFAGSVTIPVPPAIVLLGSALMAFVTARRKSA